jgi:hypothetical protein
VPGRNDKGRGVRQDCAWCDTHQGGTQATGRHDSEAMAPCSKTEPTHTPVEVNTAAAVQSWAEGEGPSGRVPRLAAGQQAASGSLWPATVKPGRARPA